MEALVLEILAMVTVVAIFLIFNVKYVLSRLTTNVCHFRFDISYHRHESLYFIDPAGSYKSSNTWINPNNKPDNITQLSAMLMKSNSHGNANISWITDSGASFHVTGVVNLNILMI